MLLSCILSSLNTNSASVLLHWLLLLAAQQPHACELFSMLVRASWLALDALGSRPPLTFFSSSSTVRALPRWKAPLLASVIGVRSSQVVIFKPPRVRASFNAVCTVPLQLGSSLRAAASLYQAWYPILRAMSKQKSLIGSCRTATASSWASFFCKQIICSRVRRCLLQNGQDCSIFACMFPCNEHRSCDGHTE